MLKFMDIRIGKMDAKIEKLLNGRMYILCRLRLAALCGLHEHTVANIWAWATLLDDVKTDSLTNSYDKLEVPFIIKVL